MAVITEIANLSQTPAMNGPDGSVDPPSSLDDQDRYLGSFIAKLRDGVGFTPGALTGPTGALGFTPVRQGTGPGQTGQQVSIGWSASGKLLASVDNNPFGNVWPIDADYATGLHSGGLIAGARLVFTWVDPNSGGAYVWCGDGPSSQFVRPVASLSVNYAASANYANSAGSAPANGGTSANSNAVNGISGWTYNNRNKNPAYLFASDGSASDQFLVTPGNLTVAVANYANSAGSAPANGGTAQNSNQLGGAPASYYVNNGSSAVVNARNAALAYLYVGVSGLGDMTFASGVSDRRLKTNIADSREDSLTKIMRIRFRQFRYGTLGGKPIDDGRLHPHGWVSQELEEINPEWIQPGGSYKTPDPFKLLASAMHAIQQLADQVKKLQAQCGTP